MGESGKYGENINTSTFWERIIFSSPSVRGVRDTRGSKIHVYMPYIKQEPVEYRRLINNVKLTAILYKVVVYLYSFLLLMFIIFTIPLK